MDHPESLESSSAVDRPATAAGVDHIGYGVTSFGDLS